MFVFDANAVSRSYVLLLKFIVPAYCFNLWIGVVSAFACFLAGKFAVRRLVYNNRPPERIKR